MLVTFFQDSINLHFDLSGKLETETDKKIIFGTILKELFSNEEPLQERLETFNSEITLLFNKVESSKKKKHQVTLLILKHHAYVRRKK